MADDIVLINAEDGIKRVMNNTKLYVRLLGKFKEDKNFIEFESAVKAKNIEKARTAVHTLKGLASNLSLIKLQKTSEEIEIQIKAGNINLDQIATAKNIYDQTVTEVDKVITQYA